MAPEKTESERVRTIKGFVCVAKDKFATSGSRQVLIVKDTNSKRDYNVLYSAKKLNNLTLFASIEDAQKVKVELGKRNGLENVHLAEMEINAALYPEWKSFRESRSLVVIWENAVGMVILGALTENSPHLYRALPACSDIQENDFTTINSFEHAEYLAGEVTRQSWSRTWLATFSLRKI